MQVYIITGTSQGLGASLSRLLSESGCLVYGISRHEGNTCGHFVKCDLSDVKQIEETVDAIFSDINFDQADSITLINNAAELGAIATLDNRLEGDSIQRQLMVNLAAPAILSSKFLEMTGHYAGKRKIVNVTSTAARQPYHGLALYCMSKAGLEMMSGCLAMEQKMKANPVEIILIDSGPMDTRMQEIIRSSRREDFPAVDRYIDKFRRRELPSPQAVAAFMIECISGNKRSEDGRYSFFEYIEER